MKKIITAIFIAFLLSSICIASNPIRVVYSFGKIEILKSGKSEWQFLKKETPLLPDDIVRMPPVSLLRLRDTDGHFLPIFTGSCELTVRELINHGKSRLKEQKGRQISSSFNSRPAVDILPTGSRFDTILNSPEKRTKEKSQAVFSEKILKIIKKFLNTIPDETEEYAKQIVVHSQFFEDKYPNRNISYARNLFMTLDKAIKTDVLPIDYIPKGIDGELKKAILYSQLLKSVGVHSDLTVDENAKPVVLFDTGISQDKIKQITVNRNLVSSRNGTLWICVSMEPTNNFILAWYKGSQSSLLILQIRRGL